jgi:long-chain acyl-CoA synthetase
MTDAPMLPPGWPKISLADANAALTAPGSPFEMGEVVDAFGRRIRTWKNGPGTLRDVFVQARSFGVRTFLVHEDERVTYEAFARATVKLASELATRGIAKGDRVALVMRNLPEWPVAMFAGLLLGAIVTPLNAWWTAEELAYGLDDSGAKAAVVDAERYERITGILLDRSALKTILVSRMTSPVAKAHVESLEDLIGAPNSWANLASAELPEVPLGPDDPSMILYTSGTTGHPKGALQSHRNGVCNVVATPFGAARNFLRRGEPIPAPDPTVQRASLLSVPFFHTTGCHAILCPTMASGGKLVLMRRWDAVAGMELIQRERITMAGGVPTIAWQILEHPDRNKYDLSSLEVVSYGGAPASAELVRRLKAAFPKSAPGIGWGMTETTGTFTGHSAEDYLNRPDSAGPCLPVCEMRIVDDDGRVLPAGMTGELVVTGPNVISGYWQKPEANAKLFADGYLKTGDLATIDEEGFLYIVDRKKDMLIRGGENIYCIEVESVLYQHPAIMDAALIGLPHRTLGEEPAAVVMLKPGMDASEADIKTFVAEHLALFKVPVRVVFRREPLPRNANGKIMKRELGALFAS